ncbi:hypothetical protein LUZ60_015174 [Juncus effusus]|nr:hypothetical protein LUZ60_015174 [Juncus effusus]
MATAAASLVSLHPAQISKGYLSHRRSIIGDSVVFCPRLFTGVSGYGNRLRYPVAAAAALALPTAKPELITKEKNIKWSARALKSFGLGELQAKKLKRSNLGTEFLLLGTLVDATSEAAKYLISKGITLERVKEEIKKRIGELDWREYSDFVIPLTESAQKALDSALALKLDSGEGEITVGHLILGIWSQKNSTGHKVLKSLGFDRKKAEEMAKIAENDAAPSYR